MGNRQRTPSRSLKKDPLSFFSREQGECDSPVRWEAMARCHREWRYICAPLSDCCRFGDAQSRRDEKSLEGALFLHIARPDPAPRVHGRRHGAAFASEVGLACWRVVYVGCSTSREASPVFFVYAEYPLPAIHDSCCRRWSERPQVLQLPSKRPILERLTNEREQ